MSQRANQNTDARQMESHSVAALILTGLIYFSKK